MKQWVLLILAVVCVLVPVIAWARTLTEEMTAGIRLLAAGRVLGLVGFVLVLLQFVLSSRVKWIERGIGLDRLLAAHAICGKVGLALVLIHPASLFASDVVQGNLLVFNSPKLVGAASLLALLLAAGFAIAYRPLHLRYETWTAIHRASYVGLPLALAHSLRLGTDLWALPLRAFWLALGGVYVAVVVHRAWNWVRVRRRPFKVLEVIQETHDTWSLCFEGKRLSHQPGQFLFLQLVRGGTGIGATPVHHLLKSDRRPALGLGQGRWRLNLHDRRYEGI